MIRIGVDVGGTFTDVTALDTEAETFHILKLPSSTDDQSISVAAGVESVLTEIGRDSGSVSYLGHGTTAATNALLELRGARTALVATDGFGDVLEIARQRRPALYDLFAEKPRVLVPRDLVVEVRERVQADGSVRLALTDQEVDRVVARLGELDVEAVAICLLHSYRNADHETRLERALRAAHPDLYVSRSSRVAPEFREYERFSTTTINSFVGPEMSSYMGRLSARVREAGVEVGFKVIQSHGGLTSPEGVADLPVSTLMSGPSAGVVGAIHVAAASGVTDLVTFDMGGTSTDVCLIEGGAVSTSRQREINGYPIRVPSANVHTIGAGGGSVASVDSAGGLRVGPESAGSMPGPAAYDRGGTRATITDANIVLGRLNPTSALGGRMAIDGAAAHRVLSALGDALALPDVEAARGVIRLANSHMARAVRKVSVDEGEDPRDYTLMAYGGAGPLHAVEVAAEVGIRRVLIPPNPGTLSALGLLVSDVSTEFVQSVLASAEPESLERLNAALGSMVQQAHAWLEDEAAIATSHEVRASADLRYPRQNFELTISLPALTLDREAMQEMISSFHASHHKAYGFSHPESPVQVVNLSVVAHGEVRRYDLPYLPAGDGTPADEVVLGHREVDFGDGPVRTPILDRAHLRAGDRVLGPAILEQVDTTTVLPPGSVAEVDRLGSLMIEVKS